MRSRRRVVGDGSLGGPEHHGLGRRYRAILSWTGLALFPAGPWMPTPLALLRAWPEEAGQAPAFLLPALALSLAGAGAGRASPHPAGRDLGMLLGRLEFFVIFVGAATLLRDVPRLSLVRGAPRPGVALPGRAVGSGRSSLFFRSSSSRLRTISRAIRSRSRPASTGRPEPLALPGGMR